MVGARKLFAAIFSSSSSMTESSSSNTMMSDSPLKKRVRMRRGAGYGVPTCTNLYSGMGSPARFDSLRRIDSASSA